MNTVTPPPQNDPIEEGSKSWRLRYLRRVHQRRVALRFFPDSAQLECGRGRVPWRDVTFRRREGSPERYATGIKSCGSVWSCPVCASRIGHRRGHELTDAIAEAQARGWRVVFATATVPHGIQHRLEDVRAALVESWRFLFMGNPWKRQAARVGFRGQVKAVEVTVGDAGWHPHIHALLFLEGDIGEAAFQELAEWMRLRWERKVRAWWMDERGGGRTLRARHLGRKIPRDHRPAFGAPHPAHSLRLVWARKSAGWYISKLGLGRELTSVQTKVGRGGNLTAFQLLESFARDPSDRWAFSRWVEYCRGMVGKRAIVWSPGLHAELSGGAELTDQEVLELAPPIDPIELIVDSDLWDLVTRPHMKGCLEDHRTGARYCNPRCRAGMEPGELEAGILYVLHRATGPPPDDVFRSIFEGLLRQVGERPSRLEHDPGARRWYVSEAAGLRVVPLDLEGLALRAFTLDAPLESEAPRAA